MKRFARPYADVLLEASAADHGEERLVSELATFVDALAANPDLLRLAANPAVSTEKKEELVSGLAAKLGFGELTTKTLTLLVRNHRLAQTGDILDAFREQLDRRDGVAEAVVVSASPLSADEEKALAASLARSVGRKIRLSVSVDPTLVAGLVATVGSTVFDASLRGEIDRVKKTLGITAPHRA